MTFPKLILITSISGILLIGCKQTESNPTEKNVVLKSAINPEKLQTASFTIDGMTCAIGCAKTIEKELSETNGVQKATVDFDKKEATVTFDNSLQTGESLTKIVESTADGSTYKVSNMITSK